MKNKLLMVSLCSLSSAYAAGLKFINYGTTTIFVTYAGTTVALQPEKASALDIPDLPQEILFFLTPTTNTISPIDRGSKGRKIKLLNLTNQKLQADCSATSGLDISAESPTLCPHSDGGVTSPELTQDIDIMFTDFALK